MFVFLLINMIINFFLIQLLLDALNKVKIIVFRNKQNKKVPKKLQVKVHGHSKSRNKMRIYNRR